MHLHVACCGCASRNACQGTTKKIKEKRKIRGDKNDIKCLSIQRAALCPMRCGQQQLVRFFHLVSHFILIDFASGCRLLLHALATRTTSETHTHSQQWHSERRQLLSVFFIFIIARWLSLSVVLRFLSLSLTHTLSRLTANEFLIRQHLTGCTY